MAAYMSAKNTPRLGVPEEFGQDISIGYLSHTDSVVRLYLQETMTFLLLTTEAVVALGPPA